MNIFLTTPYTSCAKDLCDLRLNKMILETAQLLSTAYRHLFGDLDDLYKVTHVNHPCSIWARKNVNNYAWLYEYWYLLVQERQKRFNKSHLSYDKLKFLLLPPEATIIIYNNEPITFDFNCSNIHPSTNVYMDYRKCLIQKWLTDKREPKWTNSSKPEWLTEDITAQRTALSTLSDFSKQVYIRKLLFT